MTKVFHPNPFKVSCKNAIRPVAERGIEGPDVCLTMQVLPRGKMAKASQLA